MLRYKRFLRSLCAVLLIGSCIQPAAAVSTSATSAILMDADSGRVLYQHNASARMLIASTTKVMTALLAVEKGNLAESVTVRKAETLVEGSSMYLREGEQLTLEELLYGLMLSSGNDAALVIARAVGGSVDAFVTMMNARAKELGMTDTSFANPNGLDAEGHYSTAADMGKLTCAAIQNETLMRIASTKSVSIAGRTLQNHNKLLSYQDGCIGLKTGYTRAAGRTLLSCAERDNCRLAVVTLQDGNDWADHRQLYEYGFSAYTVQTVLTRGQCVAKRPAAGSDAEVPILAARAFTWPVQENEHVTVDYSLPDELALPISTGDRIGEAILRMDGTEIGRVELVSGKTVLPAASEVPQGIFRQWKSRWK